MPVTFKDHTGTDHDFDALPEASRKALISRVTAHVFKNECASGVVGFIKKRLVDAANAARAPGAADVTTADIATDMVKAFRAANTVVCDTKMAELQTAKLAEILAGTIGTSRASVTIDPVEKMILRLARDELTAIFKAQGWKMPTATTPQKIGDSGEARTLDFVIDWWLDRNGLGAPFGNVDQGNRERLERAAKRAVEDASKKASAAAKFEGLTVG